MKNVFEYIHQKFHKRNNIHFFKDQSGSSFCNDTAKANALGTYFASVFEKISPSRGFSVDEHSGQNSLSTVYFHPSNVHRIILSLKPSCMEPIDGIPQILYKKCADNLSRPLADLFNVSMYYSEVPALWKEAIVTAIPKTSKPEYTSDFRPISHNCIAIIPSIVKRQRLESDSCLSSCPL